ncbi:ribonuclease Z [Porphyromonas sp. COT-290 OH860]|uniref:ribonuclease Z n=1 Tax=Porphyromonas sp. COT-290 OH860 TaxID=1515615 RepID=UPI00052DB929|nr:ribonuclease Z [Porphyromonas sp. COT-290 OH860]KGN83729.1 ribonuclease Z [Porphyromonas sp. COT-290 OH860]
MSDFNVHILGCGSALPTVAHLPSSQVVELRGKLYMIDCGEGAQRQMRLQRLNFGKLVAIFISHLHGDHCFGLPGLISSLGMLGRTGNLHIIGPVGLKRFLEPILEQFCDQMAYRVVLTETDTRQGQTVWEDRSVTISTIPLKHRTPTQGYLFREKVTPLHLDKASADFYGIPLAAYPAILRGEDFVSEAGEVIPNSRLTKRGREARSYAYCSDTSYLPNNAPLIKGVTLLYHEATFLTSESARAGQTGHSTAREAALMAQSAEAKRLLIGHYSARYHATDDLLAEARAIFPCTEAANEGMCLEL